MKFDKIMTNFRGIGIKKEYDFETERKKDRLY